MIFRFEGGLEDENHRYLTFYHHFSDWILFLHNIGLSCKNTGEVATMKTIEADDQAALFRWAEAFKDDHPGLEMLNGSLNGVRLTISQAVKAKAAGMKKGFPDINLPVPRGGYHGLYIELKIKPYRNHKGKMVYPVTSKEQEWWLFYLNQNGYRAVICKGFDAAVAEILGYLGR